MPRFQPGKSGNPGGRPKNLADVQELARCYTKKAIETLAAIMQNEKTAPAARVSAASAILDRGYGKPPQAYADADEGGIDLEKLIHASYRVGKKTADMRDVGHG
jgi:hypothetical protein